MTKYYWHNIGKPYSQSHWDYLRNHGLITTGFQNKNGDRGEKLLKRYRERDFIIVYANSYGALGFGQVIEPESYRLVTRKSISSSFESNHCHWINIQWLSTVRKISDGVPFEEFREKFDLYFPRGTSQEITNVDGARRLINFLRRKGTTSRIPDSMGRRFHTVYFFNNCHNLDHVKKYGAGAFFDLGTCGRQEIQAKNLLPGQVCVVGSKSSNNQVIFKWYLFEYETVLPDNGDMLNRVFFGRFLTSEELPKSESAHSSRYSTLFATTGSFKQGSVFKNGIPLADLPHGADDAKPSIPKAGKETQGGAGFGDPTENKLVESRAIRKVVREYERRGWEVCSVERAKRGFDLECQKDGIVKNVEVKGVRAAKPCFIITAGEVEQARSNPNFVLVVVMSALSESPIIREYDGTEFSRRFNPLAIQYRASLRS